ncbi:MAG: flagellar biosynthesis protein FlhB [Bacillota bacterium]
MSQERTFPATPRRRQQARERGQVFRSVELTSAVILLVTFAAIRLAAPTMGRSLAAYIVDSLSKLPTNDLTAVDIRNLFIGAGTVALKVVIPVLGAAFIAGISVNVAQVGLVLTGKGLTPDFSHINPVQGFTRLFSRRAWVELAKTLLKMVIVGYVTYSTVLSQARNLPKIIDMGMLEALRWVGTVTYWAGLRAGVMMLVMAGLDWFYQYWEYEQGLKMTRQEIIQESRETEGKPEIKGKVRERMRQLMRRRMMSQVPKADVVIANPTHFAIALRYDPLKMKAPVVIAKGQGYVALRIREIAQAARVTIVENKPLAQALYKTVEIGQSVPEQLYQAVAEVLAFVFKLKGRI